MKIIAAAALWLSVSAAFAQTAETTFPALTAVQAVALAEALRPLQLRYVEILCSAPACASAAASVAEAARAAGVKVAEYHSIFDVDPGISVGAGNQATARSIAEALGAASDRRFNPRVDPAPSPTIYISFGEKE